MKTLWLDRINEWVFRFRHIWAVGSFCLGLSSYFLVQRQPWLASVLTAFLVATWALLLTENLWSRRFRDTPMEKVSQGALKLLLQGVHQEAFFFSLPFVVLQWSGGAQYVLFTALVAGTALISIVDPLYFRLAGHRALYFGYHAWALFVALLVLLPLIFKVPTNQALDGAAWLTALFALPSFWRVGGPRPAYRWVLLCLSSAAIATTPLWGASLVPPLTLSLQDRAAAISFDREQRQPLVSGTRFSRDDLDNGLYAYTAIRAPLGLGQTVSHYWFHDGRLVDRIPLEVTGGRREGYRTWSHKTHFEGDPVGHWRVEVRTDKQQIIGVLRFQVVPAKGDEEDDGFFGFGGDDRGEADSNDAAAPARDQGGADPEEGAAKETGVAPASEQPRRDQAGEPQPAPPDSGASDDGAHQ